MDEEDIFRRTKESLSKIKENSKDLITSSKAISKAADEATKLTEAMEVALTRVIVEQTTANQKLTKVLDSYQNSRDSVLELTLAGRTVKECLTNVTYVQNSISLELTNVRRYMSGEMSPQRDKLLEEFRTTGQAIFAIDVLQNSSIDDLEFLQQTVKDELAIIKQDMVEAYQFFQEQLPQQMVEAFAKKMTAFITSENKDDLESLVPVKLKETSETQTLIPTPEDTGQFESTSNMEKDPLNQDSSPKEEPQTKQEATDENKRSKDNLVITANSNEEGLILSQAANTSAEAIRSKESSGLPQSEQPLVEAESKNREPLEKKASGEASQETVKPSTKESSEPDKPECKQSPVESKILIPAQNGLEVKPQQQQQQQVTVKKPLIAPKIGLKSKLSIQSKTRIVRTTPQKTDSKTDQEQLKKE